MKWTAVAAIIVVLSVVFVFGALFFAFILSLMGAAVVGPFTF